MADSEPSLRQRKPNPVEEEDDSPKKAKIPAARSQIDDEDAYSPWLDIVRVLTFLFVASCGLSYLISSGESWFWGMSHPPSYLRPDWWKSHFRGPNYMTLEELAKYDGADETKPIYLSINGTIYDVSAGKRIYGPGGSYHIFAGVDASRGFVTGCFGEDRNGDMRGVEEMYLPIDNPDVDKHWSKEELSKMKKEELAHAKQRVHDALKHWVDFFANSKKYHYVGELKREKGWRGKRKQLCKVAQDGRVYRKIPEETKEEGSS